MSTAIAGASASERSVVSYNSALPVSQAYVEFSEELTPELTGRRTGRKPSSPEVAISPGAFQSAFDGTFQENTTEF